MSQIKFNDKQYYVAMFTSETAVKDYQRALALRKQVFVDEQNIPLDLEVDDYEEECLHWLICDENDNPVAVARSREYQEGCQMRPVLKLERIAVDKAQRGQKLGDLIMQQLIGYADKEGYDQILLSSQEPVVGFYEKLGFETEGDRFIDAGAPHFWMRRFL